MNKLIASFAVLPLLTGAITTTPGKMPAGRFEKKDIRKSIENIKKTQAIITNGKVTSVTATSLGVTSENKSFTVTITTNTKIFRKFGGKSLNSEISIGDEVSIFGVFTDEAKTTIKARLIRDRSIQKRKGAFFGQVLSVTSNGFIIQSKERGKQTVIVSGTPKIVDRKMEPIVLSAIVAGHNIRVAGVWDKTNSQIAEISEIKDFTLPVIVTPTKGVSTKETNESK